ncbi:MAG: CHAD domain-containing protein [Gemmatimonadales bacterium]
MSRIHQLTVSELREHPESVASILSIGFLEDVGGAFRRLAEPDDVEALHDFRVAVRRLRSTLRAYKLFLPSNASAIRLRLKEMASATGPARDAEVQLEWLDRLGSVAGELPHDVVISVRRELEHARTHGYAVARERIDREFASIAADLRSSLRTTGARSTEPSILVLGGIVRRHSHSFQSKLACVNSLDDERPLHRLRIQTKRLRYLLEPLSAELDFVRPMIGELRVLQDLLGDVRDLGMLGGRFRELEPTRVPDPIERRRHRTWETFVESWRPGSGRVPYGIDQVADRVEFIIPDLL